MNTHLELQEICFGWIELQLQENRGFIGQEEQMA